MEKLRSNDIPFSVTKEWLKEKEDLFIPKRSLIHNEVYIGSCRNARVAIWNENSSKFYYLRTKFGYEFIEEIDPTEGVLDHNHDIFIPYKHFTIEKGQDPLSKRPSELSQVVDTIKYYKEYCDNRS